MCEVSGELSVIQVTIVAEARERLAVLNKQHRSLMVKELI
jgi:hypothetical protein